MELEKSSKPKKQLRCLEDALTFRVGEASRAMEASEVASDGGEAVGTTSKAREFANEATKVTGEVLEALKEDMDAAGEAAKVLRVDSA